MITVNQYFEGSVKSLSYHSRDGKSTIGVIDSGEYEFGTSCHETMQIIEGDLEALLPGHEEWRRFGAGDIFEIDANQSFKVRVSAQTSYLCKYI